MIPPIAGWLKPGLCISGFMKIELGRAKARPNNFCRAATVLLEHGHNWSRVKATKSKR